MCGKLAHGEPGSAVIKRTEICTTPYRELKVIAALELEFITV